MKKRFAKAKVNYVVDIVIGIGFLFSAVSGIVLYFAPSGGFQGGRNPHYLSTVLGLGHHSWTELHNWSSFIMTAGVVGHFILHWNWLVCMTRNLFKNKPSKRKYAACENENTAGLR